MTESTQQLILVVEDDVDIVEAIRDVLVTARYAVVDARSGSEAMAVLQRGPLPAAMIVDFMMPGMNGAQLLQLCGADPRLAAIPALVISAARPVDLAADGILCFLAKPFQPEELLDALDRILANDVQAMPG
jgi:CheY-like chemotaxis protein